MPPSDNPKLDLGRAHEIVASWPFWKRDLADRVLRPSDRPSSSRKADMNIAKLTASGERPQEIPMPRPKVDPKKKLTVKITSLFTESEGAAIERARKAQLVRTAHGERPMKKSEWIRETILPFLRAWLR